MTDSTEFDDLYDVSDDERSRESAATSAPSRTPSLRRQSSVRRRSSVGVVSPSRDSTGSRRALPRLAIPNRQDEVDLKKMTSPVAPTPTLSATIPHDAVAFMRSQQDTEIPTAPPSLDGSLTSEQMAQMSAPPTPVMGGAEDDSEAEWAGVQLQPGALATLQALSSSEDGFDDESHSHPERVIEIPADPAPEMQQQGLRLFAALPQLQTPPSAASPLAQRASFTGLTRLDIPSPGGFFADLSPRTRRTWDQPKGSPELAPPTSTTAEQFYKAPWNSDEAPALPLPPPPPRRPQQQQQQAVAPITSSPPVEHIVDAQARADEEEEDPSTARRVVKTPRTATQSAFSDTLVEQTIEARSTAADEGNPQTARRIPRTPTAHAFDTPAAADAEPSTGEDDVLKEIVVDYDPEYARKQQDVALSNLDRTELWLMAQNAYLKGVISSAEVGSKDEDDEAPAAVKEPAATTTPKPEEEFKEVTPKKKAVRFSEIVVRDIPCQLPSKATFHESAYYRAFQDYAIRSRPQDRFVHSLPRLEALQALRVSLPSHHRDRLLGKHQLSVIPQSAKKRLSANVARGDDAVIEDPAKLRADREAEARTQMATGLWQVAAEKALGGGKLISAPVGRRLMRPASLNARAAPSAEKPRVLDLGGQVAGGWAWHVALQYLNAKIYTVNTRPARQLSNCNVRGPPNHRQISVDRLTKLPFPDSHFDLVSARELHSALKYVGENGEDEWETCLAECMRVLKPGGYVDFSVLDSDVMKAGPLGLAKSVEFGFTLKRLGYDPSPTKLFLSRLERAGFEGARRAWVFLPLGAPSPPAPEKDTPLLQTNPDGSEPTTHRMSAMVSGSTAAAAPLTALAGSLAWERWLLRCEVEKVAGALRLADTVTSGAAVQEAGRCLEGFHAVVEEGRRCGAGFRVLRGYARKPVERDEGVIPIQLG